MESSHGSGRQFTHARVLCYAAFAHYDNGAVVDASPPMLVR
jgi:hypothetical protein